MKTIARNIFIILVLTGFFLPQPLLAQTSAPTTSPIPTAAPSTLPNGDPRPAAATTPTVTNEVVEKESSWWLRTAGRIADVMITIGGVVAWLGGWLLDLAIYHTVIRAGVEFTGGIGVAVNAMWSLVRDFFNLVFIFFLIYIGLRTILFSEDTGTRKLIGGVIAAALLINFSLFITKLIVDFSNLAAYQIYEQVAMRDPDLQDPDDLKPSGLSETENPLEGERTVGGAFMNALRLTTFASSESIQNANDFGTFTKIIAFGFLMMLFMIIAGFAFAAGAFLLIARFIALVIFMVLSPAMFLVFFSPGLAQHGRTWWRKFISNAFVAPAYLFMILLSLVTIERIQLNDDAAFAQIISNTDGSLAGDFGGLLLFFFIATGFVYGSALVAKQMGAAGADTAMKIASYGRNKVQGAVVGGSTYAPRWLAREGTHKASSAVSERYDKFMAGDSKFAKRFRGGTIDRSLTGTLESGKKVKFGLSQSVEDREKARQGRKRGLEGVYRFDKAKADLVGSGVGTPEARKALKDMKSEQVVEWAQTEEGLRALKLHAASLSSDQMKALKDSPELDATTKKELGDAQKAAVLSSVTAPGRGLWTANKTELATLGVDELKKPANAIHLTDEQIKSLDFDQADITDIKSKRTEAFKKVAGLPSTITDQVPLTKRDLLNKPAQAFAELPPEVVAELVKTNHGDIKLEALRIMYRKLDSSKLKAIRQELIAHSANNIPQVVNQNGQYVDAPRNTWTPEVFIYDFLNRDRVGREFGT